MVVCVCDRDYALGFLDPLRIWRIFGIGSLISQDKALHSASWQVRDVNQIGIETHLDSMNDRKKCYYSISTLLKNSRI